MNADTPPDEPATVLIVDDEEDIADIYAKALRTEYEVITAYGGEEALEKINHEVDVVLLDRLMPDLHGDQVLEEIRSRGIDCRVVMVTAVTPDVDVISLDFDDYLEKPVTPERMLNAVERMLTRNDLDKQLQEAFSLASKMATLESKMDIEELENSEEYAELEARFSDYQELFADIDPADNLYSNLSTTKMEALFMNR